jgi:uncharacterized membrane protein YecN with MAPEG domain
MTSFTYYFRCTGWLLHLITLRRGRAWARARARTHSLTHSLTRTRLLRTRHRPISETTRNIHKRQKSMLPRRFELAIPASKQPQTHTFDRAATRIGETNTYVDKIQIFLMLKMAVHTATIMLYWVGSSPLLPITCGRCVHTAGTKHLSATWRDSIQQNSAMFADCALRTGVTIRHNMWDFVFTRLWRFTTESQQVQITLPQVLCWQHCKSAAQIKRMTLRDVGFSGVDKDYAVSAGKQ